MICMSVYADLENQFASPFIVSSYVPKQVKFIKKFLAVRTLRDKIYVSFEVKVAPL